MTAPLHPVTAASRDQAVALAREVAAGHPAHYGTVPPAWLALQIREFLRFCEECSIWEPADLATIIRALFAPSPACLPPTDRDYAIRIIANTDTAAEARARSVAQALTGKAPPPREPSGYR